MPLRFTRRLSLIPGLRVNLSKGGANLSAGIRQESRIVKDFPKMTVGILKISGVAAPESLPRWHRDARSCFQFDDIGCLPSRHLISPRFEPRS
jgi:hypothetical protein